MWKKAAAFIAVLFFILPVNLMFAQTLGNAPMFNRAVQGQSGAQPGGAFYNFRTPDIPQESLRNSADLTNRVRTETCPLFTIELHFG